MMRLDDCKYNSKADLPLDVQVKAFDLRVYFLGFRKRKVIAVVLAG